MKWKNLRLASKFSIGFGSVVLILMVIAIWAINGIGNILDDSGMVIDGNKLRTNLNEKYVQHLNWANKLNSLIFDKDVTEISLQTDPHKCDFGQWYYGDGKTNTLELAPELKPLLDQMEQPHIDLHQTAVSIMDIYYPADYNLSIFMQSIRADHLAWSNKVKDALLSKKRRLEVQMDPTKCNLGKWLSQSSTHILMEKDPKIKEMFEALIVEHDKLHISARTINNYLKAGQNQQAINHFNANTKYNLDQNLSLINIVIDYNNAHLTNLKKAEDIYHDETQSHLSTLATLFNKTIDESTNYTMTDEALLSNASIIRSKGVIYSFIAIIIAIILAFVIARGLILPIRRSIAFTNKIADGDLTAEIEIDQKDEIGQMVSSLKNMADKLTTIVEDIISGADLINQASIEMSSASQQLSQGASEQASSVEEVSSSMEEMAANIQQNTENAENTEKLAVNAHSGIQSGQKSTKIASQSMSSIADKISIINDIAFQTNILALNAAVEAARAGEYGKGFAVVAAEVRKLAERSKEAAEEIDKVSKDGVKIAEEASTQLEYLVPEIQKTATLIQEISAASIEQNSGATQINSAVQQLNNVTQQNAASAEELATNAEELSGQAGLLADLVSFFKVNGSHKSQVSISSNSESSTKTQLEFIKTDEEDEAITF